MSAPESFESPVQLSKHASIRIQQRGIPKRALDLLIQYGEKKHDGHGGLLLSASKRTRRTLQERLSRSEYAQIERHLGIYAVLSAENRVITAAHRTQKRFH